MSRKFKKKKNSPFGKKVNIAALFQDAMANHQAGMLVKAEELYKTILQVNPKHADSLNLLGLIAQNDGDYNKATTLAKKAITVCKDPGFLTNLGSAYRGQKKYPQAITAYKQALLIKPDHVEGSFNLANTLLEQKDYLEACKHFEKTLQIKPNMPEALEGLGRAYIVLSQHDKALECFDHILRIQPNNLQALNNKGLTLQKLNRYDEALSTYKSAISKHPSRPEGYNNIGNVMVRKGEFAKAISYYQESIQVQPDYEEAHVNLSWTFGQHGLFTEAIECLKNICTQKPASLAAYSDFLFTLNYDPKLTNIELFENAKEWWLRFLDSTPKAEQQLPETHIDPKNEAAELLRIGFISPDFRQHPVGTFLLPLIRTLSKKNYAIHCYAEIPPTNQDIVTEEIRKHSTRWFSTWGESDTTVANQITADNIDILIDLAGHSANNRLGVLARKPAPIQVNWLGYVNTTGLPVIDYRFTDQIADPVGSEKYHSESLVHLPNGFFCYHPPAEYPDVAPLPALTSGTITFGSFNNIIKISEEVIKLWAQVLLNVPDSRFLWLSKAFSDQQIQSHFLALFRKNGVSATQIQMVSSLPMNEYLALHNKVDIALDPFPHNGHTITCHSLWMGVPVITLKGDRYAGRMGASIMSRIGLETFIAETRDEYIEIAKGLNTNIDYLKDLRSTMRERLRSSPMCNAQQFTDDFESALLNLWKNIT